MSVRHVQSTPAGLRTPDHYGGAAWPLVSEKQGLPRGVFRRSIAWLSDSLSTLRSAGYPRPTQDSLPAVGQTLLDGLLTRRVPMRGFRVLATSHPPLPSLPGAIGSTDAPGKHRRGSMSSVRLSPSTRERLLTINELADHPVSRIMERPCKLSGASGAYACCCFWRQRSITWTARR